jgi:hypothetical protein
MIKISLGGRTTKALVDSGAQISCIDERFLNATSFRNYQAKNSTVKSIIGAGGTNHDPAVDSCDIFCLLQGTHFWCAGPYHKIHTYQMADKCSDSVVCKCYTIGFTGDKVSINEYLAT